MCWKQHNSISAASTIKVNFLPGVWNLLRYLPIAFHVDRLHRHTHPAFCGMLQGVWGHLVNRCNTSRGEIERHVRKALIHVRQYHVCVSTMCQPDTCQAASCKKQRVCVPNEFYPNKQIDPHLLATLHQAATPGLGNSSSSGGQGPALPRVLLSKAKGSERAAALVRVTRTGGKGKRLYLCLGFQELHIVVALPPLKAWIGKGWPPSVGPCRRGEQGTADGGSVSQAEIHGRLQGGEKSPRQHISPGSPTLFISIIKSANTYHLSKICSSNKHSYRAYYGQWWDINLYPWKKGRKAEAMVPCRGQSLLWMRPRSFPLWKEQIENCTDFVHMLWGFFSFKIISLFMWSSYRNKQVGYYLSIPVSAGNICMRACVDLVYNYR